MRQKLSIILFFLSFLLLPKITSALTWTSGRGEVLEDIYVYINQPNSNFGGAVWIEIQSNTTHREVSMYVKFNRTALNNLTWAITNATVKLYYWGGSGDPITTRIFQVYNDNWNEDTTTWNNQMCGKGIYPVSANCSAPIDNKYVASFPFGKWHDWNVTDAIINTTGDANVSFHWHMELVGYLVVGADRNYYTKEQLAGNWYPILEVQYFVSPTTTTTIPPFYTCENPKDCSIYTGQSTGAMLGGTFCGLYNLLICIGPPYMRIVFISVGALIIVSIFGLMAYILSRRT